MIAPEEIDTGQSIIEAYSDRRAYIPDSIEPICFEFLEDV